MNLISHSRGGLISMMYATGYIEKEINENDKFGEIVYDHPFNVAGLYSMGTPYWGTDWETKFGGVAKQIVPGFFDNESAEDILDETIQQEIKDCWEHAVAVNNQLTLHAISGEASLTFILGILIEDKRIILYLRKVHKLSLREKRVDIFFC